MEPPGLPMCGPESSPREKRSFRKCQACRNRKKKCKPVDRDWNNMKERCGECVRRGDACGPPRRVSDPPAMLLPISSSVSQPGQSRDHDNVTDVTDKREAAYPGGSSATTLLLHIPTLEDSPGSGLQGSPADGSVQSPCRTVAVRQSFAQLHNADTQRAYLLTRQREVKRLQFAVGVPLSDENQRFFNGINMFLGFAVQLTKRDFTSGTNRILDLLGDINQKDREQFLLRLSSAVESFAVTTDRLHCPSDCSRTTDARLDTLQDAVLQQLITTYERRGDNAEAYRLRQRRTLLSTDAAMEPSTIQICEEAKAICEISAELARSLQDLESDSPFTRVLNPFGTKSFPPVQIALLLRREATAKFLYSRMQCLLDEVDLLGRHALHIAAELSNLDFLDFISQKDPKMLKTLLTKRDFWSLTALCIAAYIGHLGFFESLVRAGAKLDEKDGQGRDVLYYASAAGNTSIVSYLLDHNVDPNGSMMHTGSPLHGAAAAGHQTVCKILVDKGASVLWTPHNGRLAREEAQANGHTAIVDLLSKAEKAQTQTTQASLFGGLVQQDSPLIAPFSRVSRSTSLLMSSSPASPPRATQMLTNANDWQFGIQSSSTQLRSATVGPPDGCQSSPHLGVSVPTTGRLSSKLKDWELVRPVVKGTSRPLAFDRSTSSGANFSLNWVEVSERASPRSCNDKMLTEFYGPYHDIFDDA